VAGCTLLILVSIGIFVQQTPGVTGNAKIYDSDYADVLRAIGDDLPAGEVVVVSANGPQTEYYTGHEIKIPRGVDSLKSLVEYMWRNNSTHLIVFVRQSSEEMLGPVFSRSGVQSLDKPFEKVGQYATETADINLYRLRQNVTRGNIMMVTDNTKPVAAITSPVNGTVIEAAREQGGLRLDVTGTASDEESRVKTVEVFVGDFPYEPAKPKARNDWSKWHYSDFVTSEGEKLIVARVTDNAGHMEWYPINVTVSFTDGSGSGGGETRP
jgi:hypothetical protein